MRPHLKARLLRACSGLSQEEFQRQTGVDNIGGIEEGLRLPTPSQISRMCAILDLSPADCEEMLRDYESRKARNRGQGGAPSPERPPSGKRNAPSIEAIIDDAEARMAGHDPGEEAHELRSAERAEARESWQRLKEVETLEEMSLVVRISHEFQRWATVELLCDESERAASKNVERAGILARVAVAIVLSLRVPEGWYRRLLGFALAHLANFQRVAGDLESADLTMAEAKLHWAAGSDPEQLLDPGRILDLEASLRRAQRHFADSLYLLEQAAAVTRRREHVALKQAFTFEAMGDYEQAIKILVELAPRVENHSEPRLRTIQRFNLCVNLSHVGRHREAALLLPSIRQLAEELQDELDCIRTRWLEGRVASGLGQTATALQALEEARRAFAKRGMHYDVILSLLETAALLLERGDLAEVQQLTGELAPIFEKKGVHHEALKALRLFEEAAVRHAATVDFARRLLAYLFRARHDETLRFTARA
jgi:tetratricopeptide (TPR) repeat protein